MAADWLQTQPVDGRYQIFSDGQSALSRLVGAKPGTCKWTTTLLTILGCLEMEEVLQLVPGHGGLDGNELTDRAAKEAVALRLEGDGQEPVSITFQAAKALIHRDEGPAQFGALHGTGAP